MAAPTSIANANALIRAGFVETGAVKALPAISVGFLVQNLAVQSINTVG